MPDVIRGLSITPADLSDVESLYLLIHAAYRGEATSNTWSVESERARGERIGRRALVALVADKSKLLSTARFAGKVIGASLVETDGAAQCAISLLSVDPSFQGKGVGDKLLACAETAAATHFSASSVLIEVLSLQPRLIQYYRRRGYELTGKSRPYPPRLSGGAELLTLEKFSQG